MPEHSSPKQLLENATIFPQNNYELLISAAFDKKIVPEIVQENDFIRSNYQSLVPGPFEKKIVSN